MSTPLGIAVSDHVYTRGVVSSGVMRDRDVVHQLQQSRTVCGLSSQDVPVKLAAGYAAVSAYGFCRNCFPTIGEQRGRY